ncbi:MAG: C39 family peptidase [Verrucomicrobiota bacterium]
MNQTLQKTLFTRRFLAPLLSALSVCIPLSLNAQTYNWSENYGSISLGQGNSDIVSANTQAIANNACAPTAVAMGLDYLYGEDPISFANNPDGYGTVNQLITAMGTTSTGTYASGVTTGLGTYSTVDNPANDYFTYAQNSVSTPTTMAASIGSASALQAVQLGILWTSEPVSGAVSIGSGGHFVTLTGVNLAVSGSSVSGTINVLDPWGSNGETGSPYNAGTSAQSFTLSVETETLTGVGSVLEVYGWSPLGEQPNDDGAKVGTGATEYGFTQPDYGYIALDEIESIPEPSTMALLLTPLGAGLLRMLRKNRTA